MSGGRGRRLAAEALLLALAAGLIAAYVGYALLLMAAIDDAVFR